VLLGEGPRAAEPELRPRAHDEPVSIAWRAPPAGGLAYRLVVEYGGEHEAASEPGREGAPPARETHLLEIEYRELPAGGRGDALLFGLDALHYRLAQDVPKVEREIELGDDRLRILEDGEAVTDLRGAQPKEDLTPRKLLGQIVGSARVDPTGGLLGLQSRGAPVTRRFFAELPVGRALAYARFAFPESPVRPGARWSAPRFPVGPAGSLGLALSLEYTLAGFQDVEGVPCAWILLSAEQDAERLRSASGFDFDRVVASVRGEAFVELDTARLRLLRLEDDIRAVYTLGAPPAPVRTQRMRHRSQLRVETLERLPSAPPADKQASWADGRPRFGPR
jgi:hypothetical protein